MITTCGGRARASARTRVRARRRCVRRRVGAPPAPYAAASHSLVERVFQPSVAVCNCRMLCFAGRTRARENAGRRAGGRWGQRTWGWGRARGGRVRAWRTWRVSVPARARASAFITRAYLDGLPQPREELAVRAHATGEARVELCLGRFALGEHAREHVALAAERRHALGTGGVCARNVCAERVRVRQPSIGAGDTTEARARTDGTSTQR